MVGFFRILTLHLLRFFTERSRSSIPILNPTLITDENIIALLRQNDRNGIALLYDKYHAALFGVVLRVVHSRELAEEVLQDTFTKVWKNFDRYDASKGKLFTWLLSVARNTAIDQTRLSSFSQKNQNLDEHVSTLERQMNGSLNTDTIGVRQITEKLPKEYRDIIDLIYFKGYTQQETSDSLGVPLGTVKTRLRTAVNQLRTYF